MRIKLALVIPIIIALFSAFLYLDADHADAGRVEKFEQRFEINMLRDEYRDIRKRLWALEDHYTKEAAQRLEEYRELLLEQEEIQDSLDTLTGSTDKKKKEEEDGE